jgi:hypothetical protein
MTRVTTIFDFSINIRGGERADWENAAKKKRLNEHVGIQRLSGVRRNVSYFASTG